MGEVPKGLPAFERNRRKASGVPFGGVKGRGLWEDF
mgnify:CR=1 FL=1